MPRSEEVPAGIDDELSSSGSGGDEDEEDDRDEPRQKVELHYSDEEALGGGGSDAMKPSRCSYDLDEQSCGNMHPPTIANDSTEDDEADDSHSLTVTKLSAVCMSTSKTVPLLHAMDDNDAILHIIENQQDAFLCLGVADTSDEEDVRRHYKQLSLRFHPDKNSHPMAKHAFHILNGAYARALDSSQHRQAESLPTIVLGMD